MLILVLVAACVLYECGISPRAIFMGLLGVALAWWYGTEGPKISEEDLARLEEEYRDL